MPEAETKEEKQRQDGVGYGGRSSIRPKTKQKRVLADSPGFEPGTEAPEASVLSRLYYESS